jgi:hypothetical protein
MQKNEDLVHQSDQPISNSSQSSKRLTIILLYVLLLIMVGLGGYWVGARRQQSSPTGFLTKPSSFPPATPAQQLSTPTIPNSSTDPTTYWKTYINEQLGILFDYPPEWEVKPYMRAEVPNEVSRTVIDLAHHDSSGHEVMLGTLYYYLNPEKLPLEAFELKRKQIEKSNLAPPVHSELDKVVKASNGHIAYYREQAFCEPIACQIYILPGEDIIYIFQNFQHPIQNQPNQNELFSEVISTFKFTK